ncbi:MAG: cupin domain-containing protein [Myxococcales bacterium]|nr:cupin domain-containing protein [Myxococcales bacterium]
MRVPKGRSVCPFHSHLQEDEVFFVLSGRGVLRYDDDLRAIRAGDCISCPAGTQVAHQIYNPHAQDLVYLAIGAFDPQEVCIYPDSDKVAVRGVDMRGTLEEKAYFDDEPDPPRIVELAAKL